jgi:hypothetical protein
MSLSARFQILNDFEQSMRKLLRQRNLTNREMFMKDMLLVIKYVASIKEGVFLAQEIKENFETFLPKIEEEWKHANYKPLIDATEKYAMHLSQHLQKQQELFEQVSLIIASIDLINENDGVAIKATMKTTLIPIALEFKIIKLLCHIHNILFRRDQEELNSAIEEFLQEFKTLEEISTQPLLQLRGLVEQIKVAVNMPTEPTIIKKLLEKVIEIAQNFINSFHGEM